MNPEIKAKWLEDLRSGNFRKGVGKLHSMKPDLRSETAEKHTFCCLGVLCEQAVAEGIVERRFVSTYLGQGYYEYFDPNNEQDKSDTFPPGVVVRWAGLEEENPSVDLDPNEDETLIEDLGDTVSLAVLNDDHYTSFEPIADKINQL